MINDSETLSKKAFLEVPKKSENLIIIIHFTDFSRFYISKMCNSFRLFFVTFVFNKSTS